MSKNVEFREALADNGIFYRIYGEENPGRLLAMVMGFRGSMFAWPLDFVTKLAEDNKVLIFDNRGTGRSKPLENGTELRIYDFALDLKNLLDCLGHKTVNVFGYSMGGSVALEFAHDFPDYLDLLILQSTTGGGSLYVASEKDVKDRLLNPRGNTDEEKLFDFHQLCMSAEAIERHKDVLKRSWANSRNYITSQEVIQKQLNASRYFDSSDYVSSINNKTLLIHGLSDRILKPENGQRLADALPDCRGVFLEDCGHCPHIEHEEEVLALVKGFLSQPTGSKNIS